MKRILVLVVVAAFICGGISIAKDAYAKEYKIGYADLGKVFAEYKKTVDAEKNLTEKAKVKEADRKKMVDEVRKLMDEQTLLSEKAKAEKQAVIDNKKKTLQEFDDKTHEDLLKQRNEMLEGIMKDIEKVVNDYAKAQGYDLVLNSRLLLYGSEVYDLTAEVLKVLNK